MQLQRTKCADRRAKAQPQFQKPVVLIVDPKLIGGVTEPNATNGASAPSTNHFAARRMNDGREAAVSSAKVEAGGYLTPGDPTDCAVKAAGQRITSGSARCFEDTSCSTRARPLVTRMGEAHTRVSGSGSR
jgi:hypothetical protein